MAPMKRSKDSKLNPSGARPTGARRCRFQFLLICVLQLCLHPLASADSWAGRFVHGSGGGLGTGWGAIRQTIR